MSKLNRNRLTSSKKHAFSLGLILQFAVIAQSAYAGHWNLHVSGSGSASTHSNGKVAKTKTWSPPADATNSVTLASMIIGQGGGMPVSAVASISATVTGTWVPDSGSDPAPPNVVVYETSTAYANDSSSGPLGASGTPVAGTADDGVRNDIQPLPATVGTVAGHLYVTKTGGSFTIPLSLSASASASPGPSGFTPDGLGYIGTCSCSVGVGGATVSIHAQPYDFKLGPYSDPNSGSHPDGVGIDNVTGRLHFHYIWKSTDGSLANLSAIKVYEHVSNLGNTTGMYYTDAITNLPTYAPPNPPFSYAVVASYDLPDYANGAEGNIDDYQIHGPNGTDGFSTPYVAASYSTTQVWKFDDPTTNETGTILLDCGTITRSVTLNPSKYTVTKSGKTATMLLP